MLSLFVALGASKNYQFNFLFGFAFCDRIKIISNYLPAFCTLLIREGLNLKETLSQVLAQV